MRYEYINLFKIEPPFYISCAYKPQRQRWQMGDVSKIIFSVSRGHEACRWIQKTEVEFINDLQIYTLLAK